MWSLNSWPCSSHICCDRVYERTCQDEEQRGKRGIQFYRPVRFLWFFHTGRSKDTKQIRHTEKSLKKGTRGSKGAVLCCEHYLTDEIINVLTIKYCDAANACLERDVFAMLPTDISKYFRESAVFNLSANIDMSTVEMIFLPMLIHGNHWGLLVFNVHDCTVEYDDGFHYPVTSSIQQLSGRTLKTIFETTGLQRFQPSNNIIWNKVQMFRVPMPDQPSGSGSCGVGVVFCVRDLCKGFHTHFTWTFKETPMLRARLMSDLLTE